MTAHTYPLLLSWANVVEMGRRQLTFEAADYAAEQ
jgi:hypothetical protein